VKVRSLTHVGVPEPDLLESARKKRQARAAANRNEEIQAREVHCAVHDVPTDELMLLDAQTLRDLEIFKSETGGQSLFDWCNATRNQKGAKVLKARMQRPFSSRERIKATQASIQYLESAFSAFEHLPTFVTTDQIEFYIHGILPLAMSRNPIEFFFAMLDIRFGDDLRYHRIMVGVEAVSSMVRALRDILTRPELAAPRGEVAEILEEMRALLMQPGFELVTERKVWDMQPWTILRIDQVFRIHEKHAVYRLLHLVYELDALLAMTQTMRRQHLVMPMINEGGLAVSAEQVVHPLVPNAVPNPVQLDQDKRLLFLTGPNMAGKTTYLRAGAIALYLAHLGMGVPARSFSFVPAQRLYSSISLMDNLSIGVSFFRAEALRIKTIAKALAEGYRVVAIMDEPFKGTNVKDALDASLEVLLRFATREDNLFMFSSHLIEMEDRMKACSQVACFHFEADESAGTLNFDYLIRPGVSTQRLGMRVLSEEGIFDLLDGKAQSPS
jgi:DNA mismatch repair protein MutS